MKKQKMSLEKMKSVLSNVLSRDEMKEVMAGSGGGGMICGTCGNPFTGAFEWCYLTNGSCRGCYNYCGI